MENKPYIPSSQINHFSKDSMVPGLSRINPDFDLAARAVEQQVSARRLLNDAGQRRKTTERIADSAAKLVAEGGLTKAEAYNSSMTMLSGGENNSMEWGYASSLGSPLNEQQQSLLRKFDLPGNKLREFEQEIMKAAVIDKELGRSPSVFGRMQGALNDISEKNVRGSDVNKHLEAAILGVNQNDYSNGIAHEKIIANNASIVNDATDTVAMEISGRLKERYGFTDQDIEKAELIHGNSNWREQYPEVEGERHVMTLDEYKTQQKEQAEKLESERQERRFNAWRQDQDREKATYLGDMELREEFLAIGTPAAASIAERNQELASSRKQAELDHEERQMNLTDEEKEAEFNASPEDLDSLREQHDNNIAARKPAEPESAIGDESPSLDSNDKDESAPSFQGSDGPKPLHGADINLKSGQSDKAEPASPEGVEDAVSSSSPESVEDSGPQKDVGEQSNERVYKLEDLTPEQKAANKMLGIHGNNMFQDISALREVQKRSMLLDHLQNTPEGQKEFDAYVAARAGRLEENAGIKGGKLYDKTMSYMLQMDSREMEEEFPGAAKAINEERQEIDVSEEFNVVKNAIDPSVDETPEARKAAMDDLRFQKQVDIRLGTGGQPSLLDRLKESAASKFNFRKEDGSINKTKLLTTTLAGIGAGMAIAGGPASIAAYIGAKTAGHYARKALGLQEQLDPKVTDALVKSGLTKEDAIKQQKQEMMEKSGKSKWGTFLKTAAVAGVAIATGIAINHVGLDTIKSTMSDLAAQGAELFNGSELSGVDNSILGGAADLSQDFEALAETLDPDLDISEEAIEAAQAVADGGSPEVSPEAVEAAQAVADGGSPEVSPEAVEAAQAVADGIQVDAVTHTVAPGETMSHIAVDYLTERGVDFSAADLYGPDGILSQTGMNVDNINVGQSVDISELERYAQAMEAGENFVPSEGAMAMNTSASVPDPSSYNESARNNFLSQVGASQAVEQSGADIAKSNFMDHLETRNGPEGGVYANVDGQPNVAQSVASGPGVEGGFASEVPNEPRMTEAEALENLYQDLTAEALERAGPEGGTVDIEIGEAMTPEEMLASNQQPAPADSGAASSIEQKIEEAVESVPEAVSPSMANSMTVGEMQNQIEDTVRNGGFVQITASDAGTSIQAVDGIPYGIDRDDLHSAEDLYEHDDSGPSGP